MNVHEQLDRHEPAMIAILKRLVLAVVGLARHIVRPLYGSASYVMSFTRCRSSYVHRRWPGALDLEGATRVAVFVHFDRQGIIHDFVLHYLAEIARAGFTTVFVSNAPRLDPESIDRISPFCGAILQRANVGMDFGAYKDGIGALRRLDRLEALLLANDSVYGPFHDLGDVIDRMNLAEADVWGITDSWERRFHLQSYFLLFGRRALSHEAFSRFWSGVRYVQAKCWVVGHYEIGLTRHLVRGGLRCRALFPYRAAATTMLAALRRQAAEEAFTPSARRQDFLASVVKAVEYGIPLNSSHFFWDHLIVRMGCPFLKRGLLRNNPARIPGLVSWQEVLQSASKYDTDLIARHLECTLRRRAV
jgi:lipopolysaccharide biosynthesis protein